MLKKGGEVIYQNVLNIISRSRLINPDKISLHHTFSDLGVYESDIEEIILESEEQYSVKIEDLPMDTTVHEFIEMIESKVGTK